jgi:hypothetical protein
MAPDKISAITDWPVPQKVKDVQSFLGFCNFYQHFIYGYSSITVPLTRLTHTGKRWDWTPACQSAFNTLKCVFTAAPVLHPSILSRQIMVETDTSDYAIAGILSILGDNGEFHLVTFQSWTLTALELNYDTHNKELFTIFDCFTHWCHYLEGAPLTVDVATDHKNLKYFASTKVLTCRQVRWSEYLCHFNMVIRFQPGKLGDKPDALTKRWDIYPKEGDTAFSQINPQNFQLIFTSDQLSASLNTTFLEDVCLRASLVMDIDSLNREIISNYPDDPTAVSSIASATSGTSGPTC